MNVQQIKVELKDRGIDYKPNAPEKKLLGLLNDSLEAAGEAPVELSADDDDSDDDAEEEKPTDAKEKAKRKEPGPRNGAKSADKKIESSSIPQPLFRKTKKRIYPAEKGKEYENLKLVKGETVEILMLRNVRYNSNRFFQGAEYIVKKQLAEQFIEEEWAE